MASTGFDKKTCMFNAMLAEQAERYEEMKEYMKKVVKQGSPVALNTDQRNLLSVAYKNVVGARRASWRVLQSIANKEAKDSKQRQYVLAYKAKVEAELSAVCDDVLSLLNDFLLGSPTISPEEEVFYSKMKGDYYRYKAEHLVGKKRNDVVDSADDAYKAALEASKPLKSTNPIRLGLALNYSVFYFEIKQNKVAACQLAKQAFDNAVGDLEDLTEEQYKDATLIMQLLRDNLTLWQTEDIDDPMDNDLAVEQIESIE